MDQEALKRAGYEVGDYGDFLELLADEREEVEQQAG